MALIESLKAFYKDNVENVDKLNDADSILEVLRAKYGNYKGSNIEEYFKELVNNGISPGGGGGGDFNTAEVTLVVADGWSSFGLNCYNGDKGGYIGIFGADGVFFYNIYVQNDTSQKTFKLYYVGDSVDVLAYTAVTSATGDVTYDDTNRVTISGDCTITGYSDD